MYYAEKKVQEAKDIIIKYNLAALIEYDLKIDLWDFLQKTGENIYSMGIEVYNQEFRGFQYAANSTEGLNNTLQYYIENWPSEYSESSITRLKWGVGDWKYFPYENTKNFETIEKFNTEMWELREGLQEFEEIYENLFTDDEWDELDLDDEEMRSQIPEFYDITDDIIFPIANLLRDEINKALKAVKSSSSDFDNIMIGIFGVDVDRAKFNVANCAEINSPELVKIMEAELNIF